MADLRAMAATIRRWRENILAFAHEEMSFTPDPWQADVLEAFTSNDPAKRRISLQACVGPGKTAVMAICAWWFLGTQGDAHEHPKGAAVAITGDNLRDNLWSEMAQWQGRSAYLRTAFTWSSTRIFANDHPATWFLSARTWPKTGNADEQGKTLSGLHSRYVLALADESGAIPPTVLRAAEQALSNCEFGKILQAGNPISLDGMLYAAASQFRHLWFVISVTGDPSDPKRAPRVDVEWANEQIRAYGRENPWVQSYILGQFPKGTFNTLLSVDEVETAMRRVYKAEEFDYAQKRLGIDVARFGDDRTVIWPRQGLANFLPVVLRQVRTTTIAARVAVAIDHWYRRDRVPVEMILVDDTGHWGHGVIDNLLVAGLPAIPVIYSEPALDRRYANRRTEMWFTMADAVRSGASLPNIPELVAELTQPTYSFVNGKLALEPKEMVKKRLGRSPDLADACAQTYALPDQPREVFAQLQTTTHAQTDFDPFDMSRAGTSRALCDFDPFDARGSNADNDFDPFADLYRKGQ